MSGKDVFIDFISYVVGLLMIAFVVFFIILGDRFDQIMNLFISMIPLMVFSLVAVVILNIRKVEIKKKKEDANYEFNLLLNYGDKLTSDLVYTGAPILIMLIAFFIKGTVEFDDIMQSLLLFAVLYLYFKALYGKVG